MYDNVPIANRVIIDDELHFRLRAVYKEIPRFFVPEDLFIKGATVVSFSELEKWVAGRVFPAERNDARKLLEILVLEKYDPIKIAKHTKASLSSIMS